MSVEPCAITRSCVWRASQHLRARGAETQPTDLCVAITTGYEPCGQRATVHLAPDEVTGFPGQPLCGVHAAILTRTIKDALLANHEIQSELEAIERAKREYAEAQVAKENAKRRHTRKGYVYFVRKGDKVKIGTSVQPEKRIRILETQGGSKFDETIVVEGGRKVEQRYHRKFAEYRTLGEWFDMTDEIRKEMDRLG